MAFHQLSLLILLAILYGELEYGGQVFYTTHVLLACALVKGPQGFLGVGIWCPASGHLFPSVVLIYLSSDKWLCHAGSGLLKAASP